MLRWRAVGFGVAVEVVLAFLTFIVPVVGHLAVGLAGGFVAGALAGGGSRSGATHGAVTGVVGGAVMLVAGVAIAFSLGVPTLVGSVLEVSRVAFAGALVGGAVVGAAAAVGGGVAGALLRGDRDLPSGPRVRGQ